MTIPKNINRLVRVYDNGGKTCDRYTMVFSKPFYYDIDKGIKYYMYLGASGAPFHPQGFGQHGESKYSPIDRPNGKHLGKRIKFESLNDDCKQFIIQNLDEA